jgi:hypothetical protein
MAHITLPEGLPGITGTMDYDCGLVTRVPADGSVCRRNAASFIAQGYPHVTESATRLVQS